MSNPQTAEEAAIRQLSNYNKGIFDRAGSLRSGYEMRVVPEYGVGKYPVNIETGEVCEWKGKWFLDGKVLLCTECWEEGT